MGRRSPMLMDMTTVETDRRSDLVEEYDGLAVRLARQFRTQRERRDDLEQVARIGLLHAADRFDPSRERPFKAFAQATIIGELKRHLRDCTWTMRIPRSLHDSYLVVCRAVDDLTQELGRSPRMAEIAARTGLTEDQVVEAMDVRSPLPLEPHPYDWDSLGPAEGDWWTERLQDNALLVSLLAPLDSRQLRVIKLYYGEGLSQREIASRHGVSQMCISRMLSKSLQTMRRHAELQAMQE
jgi:RNA polymerase sigma-B factor